MVKWINVLDMMPPDDVVVLVFCGCGNSGHHKEAKTYRRPEYGWVDWVDDNGDCLDFVVTHWALKSEGKKL